MKTREKIKEEAQEIYFAIKEVMEKLAQTLIRSSNSIKHICCYGIVLMCHNEWLYVFGFATHILSFKAQKPIGKTDIYNVLPTGGFKRRMFD